MATFPTPPTYANPIEEDQSTKKPVFNPIWLRWFLDAARFFEGLGEGGTGIEHNGLAGLQGGSATERYHLTSAEHAALGEAFPVGAYYLSIDPTDPATTLGYGTWDLVNAGYLTLTP